MSRRGQPLALCLAFAAIMLINSKSSFAEDASVDTRTFLLSFTYQPYDWSEQAFDDTYSFIKQNGDMIFHYFDDGVPWPESYEGTEFHPNVESNIEQRKKQIYNGHKVAVGVSFLAKDRLSLAAYWADEENLDRPDEWAARSFNDPKVVKAYINYCRNMISRFNPDYFIYGMEMDSVVFDTTSERFHAIEELLSQVYSTLKKEYPQLPLVLTFMLGPEQHLNERKALLQKLLPYTDIYAVSVYPYLFDGIGGDSDKIPQNLFSKVSDIIGDKPFAISETGFNAKTWAVWSKFIWIPGSEKSQAHYVDLLLSESNKLNAEFVNWWVPRDLDALWEKMKNAGADPILSQWNSNGLVDADGKNRQGLDVWKSWFNKPIK